MFQVPCLKIKPALRALEEKSAKLEQLLVEIEEDARVKSLTRDNELFKERDHQMVIRVMELEQELSDRQEEGFAKVARLEADLKKAEEDYRVSDACCRTIAEHNNALKGKNCELSSILDVTQKAHFFGCSGQLGMFKRVKCS